MKKSIVVISFLALMCLAIPSVAGAATISSLCTSPGTDVNPPAFGVIGVSTCAVLGVIPAGSTINSITLLSRYDISLQLGGASGSATFTHAAGGVGTTVFDNVAGTAVVAPPAPTDLVWGPIACPSAACTSALLALNLGTATVTTSFSAVGGAASSVSADYQWDVDFTPPQVPEPSSLVLLGSGLIGLAGLVLKRKKS